MVSGCSEYWNTDGLVTAGGSGNNSVVGILRYYGTVGSVIAGMTVDSVPLPGKPASIASSSDTGEHTGNC